jgi:WD40 repeat protein
MMSISSELPITHSGGVSALAFSPDGRVLASADEYGTIFLRDMATGETLQRLESSLEGVGSLAFSPKGLLEIHDEDWGIHIWDPEAKSLLATVPPCWGRLSVEAGLLVEGYGEEVRWREVRSGEEVRRRFPQGADEEGRGPTTVSKSETTAVTEREQELVAWSLQTGEIVGRCLVPNSFSTWSGDTESSKRRRALKLLPDYVYYIVLSPDGRYVAMVGSNQLWLWEIRRGRQHFLYGNETDRIGSVKFSPDSRLLACSTGDGAVRWWKLPARRFGGSTPASKVATHSFAFSANGERLATGAGDGTVRLWSVASKECLQEVPGTTVETVDVVWSPDGSTLLCSYDDGHLRAWDPASGTVRYLIASGIRRRRVFAVSPEHNLLALLTRRGEADFLEVREVASGELRWSSPGGRDSLYIGGDAVTLADRNQAVVRGLERGEERPVPAGLLAALSSDFNLLELSPDGALVAVSLGSDGEGEGPIVVRSAASGEEVRHLVPPPNTQWIGSLRFTADGMYLLAESVYTLLAWCLATGELVWEAGARLEPMNRITLSPDRRWLAASGNYPWAPGSPELLEVRDMATGAPSLRLFGFRSRINALAFSPDSQTLAIGVADGTVLLCDVRSTGIDTSPLKAATHSRDWARIFDRLLPPQRFTSRLLRTLALPPTADRK